MFTKLPLIFSFSCSLLKMPFEESDEPVGQHLGSTEIMNIKCFSAQASTLLGSGILGKCHGDAWKQLAAVLPGPEDSSCWLSAAQSPCPPSSEHSDPQSTLTFS